MNSERRQVLQMLGEGTITADEAERLLDAVERDQPEPPARAKARPKYLRVLIEEAAEDDDETGRINIRVPLQLLRAGVKLVSLVPPPALARANLELGKAGVPVDLTQLKPQDIEELIEQLDEVTVDILEPGSKVQIFCE
jgi:hypothetical protein